MTSSTITPLRSAAGAITPSDSTVYSPALRGVWVGGAGNLAIEFSDGTSGIFVGVPAGYLLPVREVVKVKATGTTATDISGWC